MNTLMNTLLVYIQTYIQTFSWDNPSSYLALILIFLAIFKKWKILVLTLLTFVFASEARDLIVWNLRNAHIVVGVPIVIYCVGGLIIAIVAFIGFVNYMLE